MPTSSWSVAVRAGPRCTEFVYKYVVCTGIFLYLCQNKDVSVFWDLLFCPSILTSITLESLLWRIPAAMGLNLLPSLERVHTPHQSGVLLLGVVGDGGSPHRLSGSRLAPLWSSSWQTSAHPHLAARAVGWQVLLQRVSPGRLREGDLWDPGGGGDPQLQDSGVNMIRVPVDPPGWW